MGGRLAIIPARGGSKRILNKNIRDFCGRPMMSYVLDVAHRSKLFDVIHVSTESTEIAEVARQFGSPIQFYRPTKLADDHTPIMPVLKYVVDEFKARGFQFEEVWLLMACAPLIEVTDLHQAAELFQKSGSEDPVIAIAEYPVPIEWAFSRKTQTGELVPTAPGMFAVRSQDIEKKYFDVGAFSILPTARVEASIGAGTDTGFIGHVISKYKAVDIDDENDWAIAEAVYHVNHSEKQREIL